jgi:DNA-binding NarL/FixJ family response regulator
MISLALVDDHITTRKGIKTLLELNKDIRVIVEASNGKEFLDKLLPGKLPDIAIIDINMPEMNGYELARQMQLHYPSVKMIVLSLIREEDAVMNMISCGACGFISKSADPSALTKAVTTVYTKGFYFGGLAKKEYFGKEVMAKRPLGFNGRQYLSQKELSFINLAATDLNYKEIAEIMQVSPKTVENYRDNIFEKLAIKSRAALVLYAFKNGLIDMFGQ